MDIITNFYIIKIMNSIYLKNYTKNFPITVLLLVINSVIFIFNQITPQPIVSIPGIININSFLANFSHYELMHFGFNMLVLWQISPLIERKIRGILYLLLILFMAILITIGVSIFSQYPTLGFSGVGLGMMVFAGFLYWKNKMIAKQLLGWAIANIVIGLSPGISFAGHFMGALVGTLLFGIFYLVSPQKLKQ